MRLNLYINFPLQHVVATAQRRLKQSFHKMASDKHISEVKKEFMSTFDTPKQLAILFKWIWLLSFDFDFSLSSVGQESHQGCPHGRRREQPVRGEKGV